MSYILDQIKEAEALGIVGDNLAVRTQLVQKINDGLITHEQSLKELDKIKKKAKKEGLLIRADFTKNRVWDFEAVQQRIIFLRHEKMQQSIPTKQSEKSPTKKI